jgi:hypothetical protein
MISGIVRDADLALTRTVEVKTADGLGRLRWTGEDFDADSGDHAHASS